MTPHHSDESEAMRLFREQLEGRARRRWPDGRLGPDDDGELAYAVVTDPNTNTLRVEFPKPLDWMAFDRKSALWFRAKIDEFLEATVEKEC